MFGKIKAFFTGESSLQSSLTMDKDGSLTSRDMHIAATVLLIEMAGRDQGIASQEVEQVCTLMQKEFAIAEEDLPELVSLAVEARKNSGKIDEFVKTINESFSEAQRQRLLAMIWKIVLADGAVDKFEQRFAVQMYNRFQLTSEQAEAARSMAERGEV